MILPIGIGLMDWASQLAADFPGDNVPILLSEDAWQDWAAVVISLPSFADPSAPVPYDYQDWRPWAERLVAVVSAE